MLWGTDSAENIVALNSETSRKVAVIASTLKLRITCSPNVSGFSAYLMSLLGLMTKKSIRLETLSLINFGGR